MRALVAAAQDARRHTSYASNFDRYVGASAARRQILPDYERDLLTLDAETWRAVKADAFKRLIRNPKNGWDPLFGILNEAKAYASLAARGCSAIQMIPHSYDYKTPDMRAQSEGRLVLCEVKTITLSDDARTICAADDATRHRRSLSDHFLHGKLTRALHDAKAQLDAVPSAAARKIVYVVLHPDESLADCAAAHSVQLQTFLKESPVPGVEVEFFLFPAET